MPDLPRTDARGVERSSAASFDVIATGPAGPSSLCPATTQAGFVHAAGLRTWADAIHVAEALARAGHAVEVVMALTETTITKTAVSVHRPTRSVLDELAPCGGCGSKLAPLDDFGLCPSCSF